MRTQPKPGPALPAVSESALPERIQTREASAITGLKPRTIQLLAEQGKIPGAAQLSGRRWTFDRAKLRQWIRSKEREAWRGTSTGETASGGPGSRFEGATFDRAYEQLLGRKRAHASRWS